ncbi:hypothetical protein [Nocardia sp. NPDC050710]|uniref:hypothetical protein n=1 Tax=Nocardia sp. NPDC050710 TaxID=3157220 RepID=UPI0033CB5EC6
MSRGRGALLAAACTALVAACGSSDPKEPEEPALPPLGPVVAAAPAPGTPITDPQDLMNRLLSENDLPPGMSAVLDSNNGPGNTPTSAVVPQTRPAGCEKVLMPLSEQRPENLAANFAIYNGPNFSSIDIDAASYSNEAVAAVFSEVQQTIRNCIRYSGADSDEAVIEYRLGGLEQPPVGDASTAFQLRTSSEGFTLVSLVGIVQVGNTLAQVSVTAPESVDPGVLSDLTAAQVRKLRGITGP